VHPDQELVGLPTADALDGRLFEAHRPHGVPDIPCLNAILEGNLQFETAREVNAVVEPRMKKREARLMAINIPERMYAYFL